MAKTDYTKMEEALRDELQKMAINKIREAAPSSKNDSASSLARQRSQILAGLRVELKYFSKQGHDIYGKFKIEKTWIKELLDNPAKLTDEEWQKITHLREDLKKFKDELEQKPAEEVNEKLVQEERHKHLTKRFNVNEKWLPLK
jgi:hypothetical protein